MQFETQILLSVTEILKKPKLATKLDASHIG